MPRDPPVISATLPSSLEMKGTLTTARGKQPDPDAGVSWLVRPDDPHGEELRAAAVRVPESPSRAVDLVLARHAAHLQRNLGEPDETGRPDRVARKHAAGRVDREVAVECRRTVVDRLPASALFGETEVLQPHCLVPAERHVDLRAVDVTPRV